MTGIAQNLQAIGGRLKAARGVTLLAVSKGQSVERIREAAATGQKAFGENYVQEAVQKMERLPALEWHLIGPLQSNKVRQVVGKFALIHSVDRASLIDEIVEVEPMGRETLYLVESDLGTLRVLDIMPWIMARNCALSMRWPCLSTIT